MLLILLMNLVSWIHFMNAFTLYFTAFKSKPITDTGPQTIFSVLTAQFFPIYVCPIWAMLLVLKTFWFLISLIIPHVPLNQHSLTKQALHTAGLPSEVASQLLWIRWPTKQVIIKEALLTISQFSIWSSAYRTLSTLRSR